MKIKAICVSRERKARAFEVDSCIVTKNGIVGDIHYEMRGKHPVSILPLKEALDGFQVLGEPVSYGRFGENLLIEGVDFKELKTGMLLKADEVILEIAKIGAGGPASDNYSGFKVCSPMELYFVFCDVLSEGVLRRDEHIMISARETGSNEKENS